MTIYDIAEIAGVNASTVSRVINGKPGCGKKKREEILALLKQYNFIPDATARNLVSQRNHTVGILTDDLHSTHMNEAIAILQNELLSAGYHCYLSYVNDGTSPDAVEQGFRDLASRRVEGVLLLGQCFHDHQALEPEIIKYLPDKPVVLVNQTQPSQLENIYAIGANEPRGIHRCVELLVSRKRSNLMLLIDRGRTSTLQLKQAFEEALTKYGSEIAGCTVADVPYRGTEGEETALTIMQQHPEVNGIMCTHDRIAINAIYALQSLGREVPGDVSVIGEDNSELCKVCRPKLTSLDTMIRQITLLSAETILCAMEGRPCSHYVSLEMEMHHRDSV